jgi:hypothetical protein
MRKLVLEREDLDGYKSLEIRSNPSSDLESMNWDFSGISIFIKFGAN